jgi:hypothetical protein
MKFKHHSIIDNHRRRLFFFGFISVILLLVPLTFQTASAQSTPSGKFYYLPLLSRDSIATPYPVFGVQIESVINNGSGLPEAVQAGSYWVRFEAFDWDLIEPVPSTPPVYRWETVDEASLLNASQNGLNLIALVKYTPAWAQKYPGSTCGPIKSEAFGRWADFLSSLVDRYKNPPYNIKFWELGNEPDTPVWYDKSVFGCWGDVNDPYFGGEFYAQMLKAAYPAIKAADPQAQVLVGGLLLDNPDVATNNTALFLEGILRGGGGPFFDAVSFHCYSYPWGAVGRMSNPNWPGSVTSIPEKVLFIKDVLNRYGQGYKTLMNTESALYCDIESPECLKTQAVFAARALVEGLALRLQSVVYYAMKNDFRGLGLLRNDGTPRPAYLAYKTASSFLAKARYLRPVTGYPAGIEGHSFLTSQNTPLEVIWSADGTGITVPLLPGSSAFDFNGNPLAPAGGAVTVDYGPVYIQRS